MKLKPEYYRILFYSYTVLLVLLAVLPINSDTSSSLNNIFVVRVRLDYLLHFIIFLPWMFLLRRVRGENFRDAPLRTMGLILLSVLFASSTELVQYFLAYRTFNINDLIANSLGVLLGAVVFLK
jgi:glycopeptide antibiotics resistance protein